MNSNALLFGTLKGQWVENRYFLKEILGTGGFGAVFRADEVLRDQVLREVAVKVIAPLDDARQQEKQLNELTASVNFKHPHLLQSFSAGEFEHLGGNFLYLVMELAEYSLEQLLKQRSLSTGEVRRLVEHVALGLDHLHQSQQVHRDLKPGNVLLVENNWKISDFGLIRRTGSATHTQTSNVTGTFAYMPPEAFDGKVSTAWDVWSLGIMLVEVLKDGGLPYEFEGVTQLQKQVMMGEIKIPSLPSEFEPLANGCLQQDPRNRWQAADVLSEFCRKRVATRRSPEPKPKKKRSQIKRPVATFPLPGHLLEYEKDDIYRCHEELLNHLTNKDYEKADTDTREMMILMSKSSRKRIYRPETLNPYFINTFPIPFLMELNGLWEKFSDHKFGFKIQREIYLQEGNPIDGEFYSGSFYGFARRVGWLEGNEVLDRKQLKFDLAEPRGNLPRICYGWFNDWPIKVAAMLSHKDWDKI